MLAGSVGTTHDMAEALPLCYHGAISRKACEDLLGKKNKDGAYLIRDSETIQGAMCLCVYKNKVVYTYRLLRTHSGEYTLMVAEGLKETPFKSLDDLVRHFKQKNQGLAMHLRHCVRRKTAILKKTQKQAEADKLGCLHQLQHASETASDSCDDYVEPLPY
eukprot:XP_003968247.1 PREDICTED: SH2 domain-containing protein 1B-like [Takifugu rubripes]